MTTAVITFCILSLLLVIGKALRVAIPLLQRLYLPSSIIGGVTGLILVSIFGKYLPQDIISGMSKVPGFLINVIFASLFLGATTPRLKQICKQALPQLCIGQIMGWGQYVVGLGLAGFILAPLFGVPHVFGNLLEIGFEGGHGTVGGMSASMSAAGWEDGIALGYTIATCGMILGIVLGMIMINWALKRGHVRNVQTFEERSFIERIGIYTHPNCPSAGIQTVASDSIDSLAFHLAFIGIAILIGVGLQRGFCGLESWLFPDARVKIFSSFPLFPLCMFGGVFIQLAMQSMKLDSLIDHKQMQRLSGASLDFLVVAAMTTIKLAVVMKNWLPLLILVVVGSLWGLFVILFLAPKVFKEAWFERGIAEFGQAMGVTATGLMLLRTVDPDNHTHSVEAFGYKQLLHEPFLGGGLCTALAFTLVLNIGWFKVWLGCLLLTAIWGVVAIALIRKNKAEKASSGD